VSAPEPSGRPSLGRRRALGALRHRNYRLFFAGQVISTVGTWMQSIAQPWLVLQLTHSALWVGLVLAAQFTPVLVAGPAGGLVADRFPKRRILQVTQVLFIVPAFLLFLISYTHVAQVWMVFGCALAWGTIQLFDVPARQSFVIEMVGREDLTNAIALNSTVWNMSAVVGPSVAGILIAAVGVPFCFLVNAISFLGAIVALAMMRNLPALVPVGERQPAFQRIKEGASYAAHDPVVGVMLLVVAIFSLFAMNRLTLIPLFAEQVLHVGAAGFGFLMASLGLGALAGALTVAMVARSAEGNRQFWAALVWTMALIAFSFSRVFALSAFFLFIAGFCQIYFLAVANSRIQTATPDSLRGRVMALYAQALMGVGPIGSAQAGILATWLGAPWAMAIGAAVAGLTVIAARLLRPGVFSASPPTGDYPLPT
jgi:MFS family permease